MENMANNASSDLAVQQPSKIKRLAGSFDRHPKKLLNSPNSLTLFFSICCKYFKLLSLPAPISVLCYYFICRMICAAWHVWNIVLMSEEEQPHQYCQDCLSWECNLPPLDDCWYGPHRPDALSAVEACTEKQTNEWKNTDKVSRITLKSSQWLSPSVFLISLWVVNQVEGGLLSSHWHMLR